MPKVTWEPSHPAAKAVRTLTVDGIGSKLATYLLQELTKHTDFDFNGERIKKGEFSPPDDWDVG